MVCGTGQSGNVDEGGKDIQSSNGKGQMANGKPFEICSRLAGPFAI
jgi:hypothetical protein